MEEAKARTVVRIRKYGKVKIAGATSDHSLCFRIRVYNEIRKKDANATLQMGIMI